MVSQRTSTAKNLLLKYFLLHIWGWIIKSPLCSLFPIFSNNLYIFHHIISFNSILFLDTFCYIFTLYTSCKLKWISANKYLLHNLGYEIQSVRRNQILLHTSNILSNTTIVLNSLNAKDVIKINWLVSTWWQLWCLKSGS